MFKVFIEEKILRSIIQAESQRPNNTRSNLFKILKMSKNLYVAMDSPNLSWTKQLKEDHGLVVDTTRTDYIKSIPNYNLHNRRVVSNFLHFVNSLILFRLLVPTTIATITL